jgi:hypothetical protein
MNLPDLHAGALASVGAGGTFGLIVLMLSDFMLLCVHLRLVETLS